MGELGVRPQDAKWASAEADAIASLTRPQMLLRLPAPLSRALRRLVRLVR